MGKRIISQARGHGSLTYRVRRKAFSHRIGYPRDNGVGQVVKIIHSAGHSGPLAKILINGKVFYNLAHERMFEGQKVVIGGGNEKGNILQLKDIATKTEIYNLESKPGDGGKFIRTAGGRVEILRKEPGKVTILMPSKKEKVFNDKCRATIGVI